MKINEVLRINQAELYEGISNVIFHATGFIGAYKILSNGFIKGPEISFTRSLQGEYHKYNKIIGVIFQLDGKKLAQSYKAKPVGTEDFDIDTDDITYKGRDNMQFEDRVYAKDGIQNISKYIVNAIMFIPREYVEGNGESRFGENYLEDINMISPLIKELNRNNIQYRFVTSERGLSDRNMNDEEGFKEILAMVHKDNSRGYYSTAELDSTLRKEFNVGRDFTATLVIIPEDREDFESYTNRSMKIKGDNLKSVMDKMKSKLNNPKFNNVDVLKITDNTSGEELENI